MNAEQYFYQFINFSRTASRQERQILVRFLESVFIRKQPPSLPAAPSGSFFDLWQAALAALLPLAQTPQAPQAGLDGLNAPKAGLGGLNGLETLVIGEILAFIEETDTRLQSAEHPFMPELSLAEECAALGVARFAEYADGITSYIKNEYMTHELDPDFYMRRLRPPAAAENAENTETSETSENAKTAEAEYSNFSTTMQAFIERWKFLAEEKARRWKKETAVKQAIEFRGALEQKIQDYHHVERIFGISQNGIYKSFNTSKGKLHKVTIDVLEQADDFYKKDFALQELAGRLGRGITGTDNDAPAHTVTVSLGEEISGFTTGGRLDRLPGAEAALLLDRGLETLFYKKFAEKQLLNYETKTISKILPPAPADSGANTTCGPFILCIDTSGSMKGKPECTAKSLVFALLKRAVKDNRKCYLIMFALDTEELEITDFERNFDALCAFLGNSFYGGTDASGALSQALTLLETGGTGSGGGSGGTGGGGWEQADVVVVSDFVMPCLPPELAARISRRQELGARFYAFITGLAGGTPANPAVTRLFDRELVYHC